MLTWRSLSEILGSATFGQSFAVADFNGDGLMDVAAGQFDVGNGDVSVFY